MSSASNYATPLPPRDRLGFRTGDVTALLCVSASQASKRRPCGFRPANRSACFKRTSITMYPSTRTSAMQPWVDGDEVKNGMGGIA
jgi:hypothetical protein